MFTLTDESVGEHTHIVCVDGELDAATHLQFEDALDRVIQSGKSRVIVDLTQATFLDSTALSGLLSAARRLRRPNCALAVVVGEHAQPRARFDLTGTGEVLNVCGSREEALAVVEHAPNRDPRSPARVQLRLYVNGGMPSSRRAVHALQELRRDHFPSDADIEIIDIAQRPDVAEAERLLALPALVRLSPEPVRRLIGDLTNHEQVLYALDLVPLDEALG